MAVSARHRRTRPNPRVVKRYRSYYVEEVASLLGVHRNTVRQWVKQGLETNDTHRPILIIGRHLVTFLTARRSQRRKKCGSGEMYCVRCRVPRKPAGDMAEYKATSSTLGSLVGICPCCETLMFRRTSLAKLELVRADLQVTLAKGVEHIADSHTYSVNSALK